MSCSIPRPHWRGGGPCCPCSHRSGVRQPWGLALHSLGLGKVRHNLGNPSWGPRLEQKLRAPFGRVAGKGGVGPTALYQAPRAGWTAAVSSHSIPTSLGVTFLSPLWVFTLIPFPSQTRILGLLCGCAQTLPHYPLNLRLLSHSQPTVAFACLLTESLFCHCHLREELNAHYASQPSGISRHNRPEQPDESVPSCGLPVSSVQGLCLRAGSKDGPGQFILEWGRWSPSSSVTSGTLPLCSCSWCPALSGCDCLLSSLGSLSSACFVSLLCIRPWHLKVDT